MIDLTNIPDEILVKELTKRGYEVYKWQDYDWEDEED